VELALGTAPAERSVPALNAAGIDFGLPLREAREQFERSYLLHQLNEAGGSVGKLAKMVGMERTHLYRKLKDLGIDPKSTGRED
jgi:DNA-binding NtrC family response regulator